MRKTTLGKRILVMVLAFVMLLTGIIPGGFSIQTVKAADTSIWFEYAGSSEKQYLDDNDTITLKTTDEGKFVGDGIADWDCVYVYQYPGTTSTKTCYMILTDGSLRYSYFCQSLKTDLGELKGLSAVALNSAGATVKNFTINIVKETTALDTSALETVIGSA